MSRPRLLRWYQVHKWSSLICTLFLLVLCLTGLPLVFHDEIADWNHAAPAVDTASQLPALSLDTIAATALKRYPHDRIASMFSDDDEPKVGVALIAPGPGAHQQHFLVLDARTATVMSDSLQPVSPAPRLPWVTNVMAVVLTVHKDLFAGLPGELFLALMGILFVAAIASGVALYGPFMKKLDFGTVRGRHSSRLKWLDLHNLMGVVLLGWTVVVGITGIFNELSTPLTGLWQLTEIPRLLAPYKGRPLPTSSEMVSPQTAMDAARRALPGMITRYIAYPGDVFGTSPQHYVIFARGGTPLTFELIVPVLVDARTGRVERTVRLPWYLQALELSRPLHFGDYAGLPLKILWASFDLMTIGVLASGLYLWGARRTTRDERLAALIALQERAPVN